MIDAPIVLSVIVALATMLLVWSGAEIGAAGSWPTTARLYRTRTIQPARAFPVHGPRAALRANVGVMLMVGAGRNGC